MTRLLYLAALPGVILVMPILTLIWLVFLAVAIARDLRRLRAQRVRDLARFDAAGRRLRAIGARNDQLAWRLKALGGEPTKRTLH